MTNLGAQRRSARGGTNPRSGAEIRLWRNESSQPAAVRRGGWAERTLAA